MSVMVDWPKLATILKQNRPEHESVASMDRIEFPTNVYTLIRSLAKHRNAILRVTDITSNIVYFVVVDHHNDKSFIGRQVRVPRNNVMFSGTNKAEVLESLKVGARLWVKWLHKPADKEKHYPQPYIEHIRLPHRKTISNYARY